MLVARLPCGPFVQQLHWVDGRGTLVVVQNQAEGRRWRLVPADPWATPDLRAAAPYDALAAAGRARGVQPARRRPLRARHQRGGGQRDPRPGDVRGNRQRDRAAVTNAPSARHVRAGPCRAVARSLATPFSRSACGPRTRRPSPPGKDQGRNTDTMARILTSGREFGNLRRPARRLSPRHQERTCPMPRQASPASRTGPSPCSPNGRSCTPACRARSAAVPRPGCGCGTGRSTSSATRSPACRSSGT